MVTLQLPPDQAVARLILRWRMSNQSLAQATGTTPRTVVRWSKGETLPQRESRELLAELIALDARLLESFDSQRAAQAWLHSDNRFLGGLSPVDAILARRIDRVEAALEALDSGIFV